MCSIFFENSNCFKTFISRDSTTNYIISVLPSGGGTAYDSVVLRVSVAAKHSFEITTPATDQTGRSLTDVSFPIEIYNSGNIRDTMALSVIDQSESPEWDAVFEDENGMRFSEIDVDPRSTKLVYLVVGIPEGEELDNSRLNRSRPE